MYRVMDWCFAATDHTKGSWWLEAAEGTRSGWKESRHWVTRSKVGNQWTKERSGLLL